jgi:adenylate cyclase
VSDAPSRKLAVLVHADVVGSTALVQLDESIAHQRIQDTFRRFSEIIAGHGGITHEIRGDALVAEFSRASDAVSASTAFQSANTAHNEELPDDVRPVVRVGIAMGEVVIADNTITGEGIVMAQRLEQLAHPGGVCIQGAAYETVPKRLAFAYENLGERELKGFDEPVRVYAITQQSRTDAPARPGAAAPGLADKPSIAVLPFTNMSDDPEQEYFSDGITEDIIMELSKISGLFVIARHSAFTYKGKSVTLSQVGRELGVRHVLEGSVRKAGNRLRITAQLVDASSDHHVWADRYDRGIEDVFAVQDEVARSVAAALAVALNPDEQERLSRPPTENIAAYDLYLRTRATPWPPTRENILAARRAYERITELEPAFVGGHAGAALVGALSVIFGHSSEPAADAASAIETAEKALTIDAQFALGHSALGLAYVASGQPDQGVSAATTAIDLQPGDSDAHAFLAMALLAAGRAEAASQAAETALRLDPQYISGPYLNILGLAHFLAGDYEGAIDAFRRNLERGGPIGAPALAGLTASYAAAGRTEEARQSAAELLRFFPGFSISRSRTVIVFNSLDPEWLATHLREAGVPE